VPAAAGHVRKVSALISYLKRYKNLDEAFGSINKKAGAWIRHNPATGAGDKDVTRYGYVLVESDDLPIEEQKKLLTSFKLPIAALLESGGKSVHAIVKIDAADKAEFRQRTDFLFDWLQKHNFTVDENNKNPARLSRLPGAERNGKIQKLISVNIGCASWADWKDFIEGIDDDLPPILDFFEQAQNPPQLSPELIGGILREGNKMIITGESKAGKTCLSQELAVCIAEGKPWLGKFKCEQGPVLYINLEVEEASLFFRFKTIYEANGWEIGENAHNIHPWNLRGKALPLDQLADKVIRRCRGQHYKLIILDPLYKVQQGDENSAEAISKFCNALDKIAHETGAAVVYDHHHPKGNTGDKKITDRGSGSGVFARDADAICDLSFLSPSKELLQVIGSQIQSGEKPMQIAFVLRDFKDVEPINIWFKFPCHYVDSANLLEGSPLEGSREDNLNKSSKRTSDDDKHTALSEAFEYCKNEDGTALIKEMADFTQGHPARRTLERYIERFNDEFELKDGVVRRLK
jgi:RecA-family ATPase